MTPVDRSQYEEKALEAMRYGDALYGIPAVKPGLPFIDIQQQFLIPKDSITRMKTGTEEDLLSAAKDLTYGEVNGLALANKKAHIGGSESKEDLVVQYLTKTEIQHSI